MLVAAAAPPHGRRRDRRRPARAVRPGRRRRAPGRDVLRRDAPPARHRHEPDRRHRPCSSSTSRRPGSTRSRGSRSGETVRALAGQGTTVLLTTQYLDEAEAARRPDRDPAPRSDHRRRHARRAQAAAPADQGRVRREATHPRRHLPRHRRQRLVDQLRKTHGHQASPRHHRPAQAVAAPHPAQPRHDHHHGHHADRDAAAVRLRLRQRDPRRRRQVRQLPAARHPAHHRRLRHRLHGVPAVHRCLGRHLRAVPVDADRPVGRCCGATC